VSNETLKTDEKSFKANKDKYSFNLDYFYTDNNFLRNYKERINEILNENNQAKIIDFEYYLLDSIYCLNEIINIANSYGKSFMISHSFLASVHEKLMQWSFFYRNYINILLDLKKKSEEKENKFIKLKIESEKFEEKLKYYKMELEEKEKKLKYFKMELETENKLKYLIGVVNISFITKHYQEEQAIRRYYSAIETHTEGSAYKNIIENMCFLNDDYNDKHFHFFAAIERYKINTGRIKRKINNLKKCSKTKNKTNEKDYDFRGIYKYENYLGTIEKPINQK
jgi:hypothetical protein